MTDAKEARRAATRRYIEHLEQKTGLAISRLADGTDVEGTTLTRFMRPNYTGELRKKTLLALQDKHRVPLPAELAALISRPASTADEGEVGAPLIEAPASAIHLYAMYAVTGLPDFAKNERHGDEVPRLPGIAKARSVYAVRMPDDSMWPWRRPDELVYIDPTRVVAEGDHVLVEMSHPHNEHHPGSLFRIRRFLARNRDGTHRLQRYDSPEVETLAKARVLALHRILEWHEVAIG